MSDSNVSNNQPICPWCGHPNQDDFEMGGYQEIECSKCWQPFKFIRCVEISYVVDRMEVTE